MKYKVVLKGEDGKTYYGNLEWLKQNIGLCKFQAEVKAKDIRGSDRMRALEKILNSILVEFFKLEIYTLIKEKKKHFRLCSITYTLSHRSFFYSSKLEAFHKMVDSGEILKGSRGWYRTNPDLVFDLREKER